jgi:hypothetical protein
MVASLAKRPPSLPQFGGARAQTDHPTDWSTIGNEN